MSMAPADEFSLEQPLHGMLPAPGSRIVVAGGCGGIGRAVVAAALAHGVEVIVLDLAESIAAHAPAAGVAAAIACDAGNEEQVAAAFGRIAARWPAVDALVHLVGYTRERVPIESMSSAEWDAIVAGNLRSTFLTSRAAIPLLRAAAEAGRAPSILLTASTFGVRVSLSGYGPYAASKAGVISMCKALATECAPQIRVNAIAPGVIETEFLRGGTGRPPKSTGLPLDRFAAGVPLGRLGRPADIAGPMLFLLSPAAAYITGQTLHVNGGTWAA
ncbi:MAG: SDR family NAD(P)-dependent oxidoreductase [Burkholderiaceae bacterium]